MQLAYRVQIITFLRGSNTTPRPDFAVTSGGVVIDQWGLTPPPTPRQIEHCYSMIVMVQVADLSHENLKVKSSHE